MMNASDKALYGAAYDGHLDLVKKLIADGADVEAEASDEPTALHCAAMNGHLEVCKVLVAAGACVFSADIVEVLLDAIAPPGTPLAKVSGEFEEAMGLADDFLDEDHRRSVLLIQARLAELQADEITKDLDGSLRPSKPLPSRRGTARL